MGDSTKKKILLVDDDFDFRFQQKVGLEAAGFEIVEAEGESEATQLLAEQKFDMAIVDLMMEQSDGGFTLCYLMKKDVPDSSAAVAPTTLNNPSPRASGMLIYRSVAAGNLRISEVTNARPKMMRT